MPTMADMNDILAQALGALTRQPAACAVQSTQDAGGLLPEEETLVARAVERRRSEFAAGRRAARLALGKLGCPACPLMIGALREPLFPPGFAGSITHDGRYAAAIAWPVARDTSSLSLDLIDGADLAVFPEVAGIITHPGEPHWDTDIALARVFSAKEAAVKILSPRLRRWVDLRMLRAAEAEQGYTVTLDGEPGAIRVRTIQAGRVILSLGMALETQLEAM
jgi:4'-phosphopantetheinyl transferase EntD